MEFDLFLHYSLFLGSRISLHTLLCLLPIRKHNVVFNRWLLSLASPLFKILGLILALERWLSLLILVNRALTLLSGLQRVFINSWKNETCFAWFNFLHVWDARWLTECGSLIVLEFLPSSWLCALSAYSLTLHCFLLLQMPLRSRDFVYLCDSPCCLADARLKLPGLEILLGRDLTIEVWLALVAEVLSLGVACLISIELVCELSETLRYAWVVIHVLWDCAWFWHDLASCCRCVHWSKLLIDLVGAQRWLIRVDHGCIK